MTWYGLRAYQEVEEQILSEVIREGYTVVEWGGVEIK